MKGKRPPKLKQYKIILSGNAFVETTYRLFATSPAEAESMAKSGEYECEDESILEKSDTDCEVTEETGHNRPKKAR